MSKVNQADALWESNLQTYHKMIADIPLRLLLVCNHLADNEPKITDKKREFSIVSKIEKVEGVNLVVSKNHYLPKQTPEPYKIDYLEDPKIHEYDVVIHRHPDGNHSFSPIDMEYINQNFRLSILYTRPKGFVKAVYNYKVSEMSYLQVDVEVRLQCNLGKIDTKNIIIPEVKTVVTTPAYKGTADFHQRGQKTIPSEELDVSKDSTWKTRTEVEYEDEIQTGLEDDTIGNKMSLFSADGLLYD
jgi:hypothetical protein